jgi:hypothetical protein
VCWPWLAYFKCHLQMRKSCYGAVRCINKGLMSLRQSSFCRANSSLSKVNSGAYINFLFKKLEWMRINQSVFFGVRHDLSSTGKCLALCLNGKTVTGRLASTYKSLRTTQCSIAQIIFHLLVLLYLSLSILCFRAVLP